MVPRPFFADSKLLSRQVVCLFVTHLAACAVSAAGDDYEYRVGWNTGFANTDRYGGIPSGYAVFDGVPSHLTTSARQKWEAGQLTSSEQYLANYVPDSKKYFPDGVVRTDSPEWRTFVRDQATLSRVKPRGLPGAGGVIRERAIKSVESMLPDPYQVAKLQPDELNKFKSLPKKAVDAMAKSRLRQTFGDVSELTGLGEASRERWKAATDSYADELIETARTAIDANPKDVSDAIKILYKQSKEFPDTKLSGAIGKLIDALFGDIDELLARFRSDFETAGEQFSDFGDGGFGTLDTQLDQALAEATASASAIRGDTARANAGASDRLAEAGVAVKNFDEKANALVAAARAASAQSVTDTITGASRPPQASGGLVKPKDGSELYDVECNLNGWEIVRGLDRREAESLIATSKAMTDERAHARIRIIRGPYSL